VVRVSGGSPSDNREMFPVRPVSREVGGKPVQDCWRQRGLPQRLKIRLHETGKRIAGDVTDRLRLVGGSRLITPWDRNERSLA
jgi:hypothetical protein